MKKFVIVIIILVLALVFGFLFAVAMKQFGKIASSAQVPAGAPGIIASAPQMPAMSGMAAIGVSKPQLEPKMPPMPTQAYLPMAMPTTIGMDMVIFSPAIMEAVQDPEKKALFLKEAIRQNLGQSEESKKIIERVQENVMLGELFEKEAIAQVQISEEELKDYYKKHENEFKFPGAPGFDAIKEIVRIRANDELQRQKLNSFIEKLKKQSSQ